VNVIVECRAVSTQQSQTKSFPRQESARNNRATVGNGVLYGGPCPWVMRPTEARISSWKGVAIQRRLEPGSRGIAIVGAITRQLLVKTLRAGKDLPCALEICKCNYELC
jgi:hypothetical protein